MQMRVAEVDQDGQASDRDVAPGQPGVILYKGPNVFAGYLNAADTGQAFTRDGWFVSGDIGWVDEQQRLRLSGRSKDLIIRSGHNIDPKVIEDAVGAHPAVKFAAAVGAPDPYAGELPVVFVALHDRGHATAEELLQFAAARVDEPPARPKRVYVVDAMPMTNVGKIYKPQLRAMAAQATAQQIIEQVSARHGVPAHAQPRAVCTEAEGLAVTLVSLHSAAFEEALRAALAELPLQNQRVLRTSADCAGQAGPRS
jgi:fatty-acyl-CoA synthase